MTELGGLRLGIHRPFEEASRARHCFTIRSGDGSLPDLTAALEASGLDKVFAATLRQVHGDTVVIRSALPATGRSAPGRETSPEADGQATRDRGIALALRTADCVPVLVADPEGGAVGTAHAGWRGTALAVAQRLVERMSGSLGCDPSRLVALCGPAIGPCCYVVGEEVASIFEKMFDSDPRIVRREKSGVRARTGPDEGGADGSADHARPRIDLAGANAIQLARAGIPETAIYSCRTCTACRPDLFPSYRGQGPGAGRLWSFIAPLR